MERILPRVMSVAACNTANNALNELGIPPIDKVLIAISNKATTRASGIIIPEKSDSITKKGTIVQIGLISEDYHFLKQLLQIGVIVTYGNYAGKQIEHQEYELEGYDLMVLSIQEIMYFEFQKENIES